MNIRKGRKEDMPKVLDLIQELAAFEKEPDAVVVTVADLERDGFQENPLFHTFIAEVEGQIVGMALYYYRYSTWKGKTIHLEDLIVKEKMRGSDEIAFFELEKYRRTSMPFATFILTLIGVSMASRKTRGGIGLHIGLGMLISFSYILFLQVSITFATNGNLSPLIAVWIPNILYFFIALVLLRLAPK